MGKVLIAIIILALIAFAAFGQYVSVRNTLVTKNEAVKASWSQVDIVLQRRADLSPNLVATVKGYAQQEQTVFGDIAKARSALLSAGTPADKIAANGQLDGAVSRSGQIAGAYVHGLFAEDDQRAAWLAALETTAGISYEPTIERTLDALADHCEAHLDCDALLGAAR